MTRRTGSHGLPAEYRTPDGEHESWEATLGYLKALGDCGSPIVVATTDKRIINRYTEQIGFLRYGGRDHRDPNRPPYEWFSLFWPDPEQLAGRVRLYEHLFEGATLSTMDGDDYFGLELAFGTTRVVFLDSNINLDDAHPKRTRELDDLPTAEEVERDLAAFPESEVSQRIRSQIVALRGQLVELGAERAKTMSDSDLMATAVRIRWKVRQHLARGESLVEADWIRALAEAIVRGDIVVADPHPES
jgi:hypothetical protein